jgi:hypothetical protein
MFNVLSCVGHELNCFATSTQECSHNACSLLGRSILYFQGIILPEVVKGINKACIDLIKNCFIAIPILALSQGHFGDAVVSTIVISVAAIDWLIRDTDFREGSALVLGSPLALAIVTNTLNALATGNSVYVLSAVIQTICFTKLILIAKGDNY